MKTNLVNNTHSNLLLQNNYLNKKDNTLKTDFSELLDQAFKDKDDKKLYKTCQDLESVFLAKMFESMRSTIPESKFMPKSFATQTFESMMFDEYSQLISKTNSLGIADMIYRQLKQQINK